VTFAEVAYGLPTIFCNDNVVAFRGEGRAQRRENFLPLRNRPEDIPELVHYFLRQQSVEMGIDEPSIQDKAMQFLQEQPWHGNLRELQSALRRALLVKPGFPITLKDFQRVMIENAGSVSRV
jgi:DNA-binding NtrC family response regulator